MASIHKARSLAKERLRGTLSPIILRSRGPVFEPRNALVVSGYFRSGTTWLAERIAKASQAAIVFEPFHVENVPRARQEGLSYVNFKHPDAAWLGGKDFMDQILSGQMLNTWTAGHIPIRDAFTAKRLVVKLVSSNQMLVWIKRHTDIPPPVLIIRHPCAVLASWISRGWRLNDWIMRDEALLDSFQGIENIVDGLQTHEQIFAARWCIDHYVPLMQRRENELKLVSFEKLVVDGADYLQTILNHWGIVVEADALEGFRKPSQKASSEVLQDYSTVIGGWQRKLSERQIRDVLEVVQSFGLDFYTREAEPDYDRLFGQQPVIPIENVG